MERNSFVFYKDWMEAIRDLPDDVRLDIYECVIEYATTGNIKGLKPMANIAFNFIKTTIDRDIEKYGAIVERNRRNGINGGRPTNPKEPKKPSGLFGNPKEPKKPDNDSDIVNVNDNEIDNVSLCGEIDARASDTERETFFEIFFFKNFKKPAEEVERFCANYEAAGWIRSNGQPVVDRVALSKTWTPENKTETPRFPANFLDPWKILYRDAKKELPGDAHILIWELEGVLLDKGRLVLICNTDAMPKLIEGNIDYFRRFFKKFFPDNKLSYKIINRA